jgi:hypothetical protein
MITVHAKTNKNKRFQVQVIDQCVTFWKLLQDTKKEKKLLRNEIKTIHLLGMMGLHHQVLCRKFT